MHISYLVKLFCLAFLLNACQQQKDGNTSHIDSGRNLPETLQSDTNQMVSEREFTQEEEVRLPPVRRQWRREITKPLKWLHLAKGLDYAYAEAPIACNIGDSHFSILRADPFFYEASIFSAKTLGSQSVPADSWAAKQDLTALVNAGMYQMDHLTNVGHMVAQGKVNQKRFSKDKAFFVSSPKTDSLPTWQIIDRDCQDWEHLIEQYENVTQSIRMLNCSRTNVWGQQPNYWSMAAVGTDDKDRLLFLFCRSPYSVHDFIAMAKELPIHLQRCMYLEGGPEASFFIQTADTTIGKMGSYETGFFESDDNSEFWSIPNVIGLRSRHNKP